VGVCGLPGGRGRTVRVKRGHRPAPGSRSVGRDGGEAPRPVIIVAPLAPAPGIRSVGREVGGVPRSGVVFAPSPLLFHFAKREYQIDKTVFFSLHNENILMIKKYFFFLLTL